MFLCLFPIRFDNSYVSDQRKPIKPGTKLRTQANIRIYQWSSYKNNEKSFANIMENATEALATLNFFTDY